MTKTGISIAPRLVSTETRVSITFEVPGFTKDLLQNIADSETTSVSWVLEQIINDYFHLIEIEYKTKIKDLKKRQVKKRKFTARS